MTADDIAPLCHCGGILIRKPRKPTLLRPNEKPTDLAVCPRCWKAAGVWEDVVQRCLEERREAHP